MNETLPTPVREEDIQAAKELAEEATSMSGVAILREMLADQNGGSTTITTETGEQIEVKNIGTERFSELGKKATREVVDVMPVHSESWKTEQK